MRTAGIRRGEGGIYADATGAATTTELDDSIRTACGCVGNHLTDPDMLQAMEKTWPRVG
jgi:hypothetical protein